MTPRPKRPSHSPGHLVVDPVAGQPTGGQEYGLLLTAAYSSASLKYPKIG